MKPLTTAQMKELDETAISEYGIPSLLLMENAGRSIAELAQKIANGKRILIVCGKGNNGGDGFAAARHLFNRDFDVSIALIGQVERLKSDPKINLDIVRKMKIPVAQIEGKEDFQKLGALLQNAHFVIDAIFGVGLARDVRGIDAKAIELINQSKRHVLAVDIPSGIGSDSGASDFRLSYRNLRSR